MLVHSVDGDRGGGARGLAGGRVSERAAAAAAMLAAICSSGAILPGDRIRSVNDVLVHDLTIDEVNDLFESGRGVVSLGVEFDVYGRWAAICAFSNARVLQKLALRCAASSPFACAKAAPRWASSLSRAAVAKTIASS